MLASEVIQKARLTLSDTDTDSLRWTDDRLLSLLNDVLLDIASTTKIYNTVGYVKLHSGVGVYDISNGSIRIERIEYLSETIPKFSFSEMDQKFDSGWQLHSGDTPEAVVYDLKRSGEFLVYPIPVSGARDLVESNSDYGIITGLYYEDAELEILNDFGDIADPNYAEYLKVYYVKSPVKVESTDQELEAVVDRTMSSLMARYIAGFALRDNMDTRNREVGNEDIQLYMADKDKLVINRSIGDVTRVRTSQYRPME